MKKLFIIFVIFLCFLPPLALAAKTLQKCLYKANAKRAMLAKLRGGDFAHAGDIEAIDFVISELAADSKIKNGNILDLGSGYGGTAEYMYEKGFKKIWGIDKDKNAIEYSTLKYPDITFFHLDAANLTEKFRKEFFSLIYIFNVTYAIPDKDTLLKDLSSLSQKGAILAIFDYAISDSAKNHNPLDPKEKPLVMRDFAGSIMYPIEVEKFHKSLERHNWKLIKSIDITKEYIMWYEKFMKNMAKKKPELVRTYQEKDIEEVENLFNRLLSNFKNNEVGGYLIIAEKI